MINELNKKSRKEQNDGKKSELELRLRIARLEEEINEYKIELENAIPERKATLEQFILTTKQTLNLELQQLQQANQGVKRSRSEFENTSLLISSHEENPYDIIKSGKPSGRFIQWETPIPLAPFTNTSSIFVRDSYNDIYNLILGRFNTKASRHHLVTGVPGIGKSTFSLYFLWRYLNDYPDAPVLCEFIYETITLLHPQGSQKYSRMGCPLMKYPYLIDFINSNEPLPGLGSFQVVFSSPDESRYKNMMKNMNSSRYVMPVWTIEELYLLCPSFPAISVDMVNERFALVGGVPRHCFADPEKDVKKMVENKISEKGFDLIHQYMTKGFSFLEKDISHLLLHCHPDEMNGYCTENNNLDWATPTIFQMLFNAWRSAFRVSGANYFNLGPGSLGGAPAGLLFEKLCLHSDPINGVQYIQKLPLAESSSTLTLNIPERKLYDNIGTDLDTEVNVLYIPNQKNFESADAFYLSSSNELIVLQLTVGVNHPVKMNGLNRIVELFAGKSILSYHLVFVVPVNGQLISKQSILTSDNKVAKVKTSQVQEFEANQWRLQYHLPVPNTS